MDAPSADSSAEKPQSGRQRVIASCLTCRRRKVGCDHKVPSCTACLRGGHVCQYVRIPSTQSTSPASLGRVQKDGARSASFSLLEARLERLESLVARAIDTTDPSGSPFARTVATASETSSQASRSPRLRIVPSSSQSDSGALGLASDGHDGTVLLEDGQTRFVSPLHWSLVTDEIQDLKALLREANSGLPPPHGDLLGKPSLSPKKVEINCAPFAPDTPDDSHILLREFLTNVNSITRLFHVPTFINRFPLEHAEKLTPLAFAIWYAAVNSLRPAAVLELFGKDRAELLERYEAGLEAALHNADYLRTGSLEVLQAFMLWLLCNCREDAVATVWTLVGLVVRIAMSQGLHRDPSSFPHQSMDEVQVELRRRLWYMLLIIDFTAAEARGLDQIIPEDSYTTQLPRNVDENNLVEGRQPPPDLPLHPEVTSYSFQFIRVTGFVYLRKVFEKTSKVMQAIKARDDVGHHSVNPVTELQNLFRDVQAAVNEMRAVNEKHVLQGCRADIPAQKFVADLASLMECRIWTVFWSRIPKVYREIIFAPDFRATMFSHYLTQMENLNLALTSPHAERFYWYVSTHFGIHAIMPLVSELRDPSFEIPDRSRAISCLQTTRSIRMLSSSRTWTVISGIIDKLMSETAYDDDAIPIDSEPLQTHTGPAGYRSPHQPHGSSPQQDLMWEAAMRPKGSTVMPPHDFGAIHFPPTTMAPGPEFNQFSSADISNIQLDWNDQQFQPVDMSTFYEQHWPSQGRPH